MSFALGPKVLRNDWNELLAHYWLAFLGVVFMIILIIITPLIGWVLNNSSDLNQRPFIYNMKPFHTFRPGTASFIAASFAAVDVAHKNVKQDHNRENK